MKVMEAEFAKEFIRLCEDGWKKGWHEYHGGNLSYRLSTEEIEQVRDGLSQDRAGWVTMEREYPVLGGEFFAVTGSGECFRNAVVCPENAFGIVELNEKGNAYRVLWGLEKNGGKPTSEFLPHLSIHAIKKELAGDKYHLVYHCHPTNIIAASYILEHDENTFTKALWDMEPECPMTFPDGIGIIDWVVPGTAELAEATGELMKKHDVVLWSQHGILAVGEGFDDTFGIADTVEKASEILLKIMSVGTYTGKTPGKAQYKDLAEVFHPNLDEKHMG